MITSPGRPKSSYATDPRNEFGHVERNYMTESIKKMTEGYIKLHEITIFLK